MITNEELRIKIKNILSRGKGYRLVDYLRILEEYTDEIISIFKEAGYASPEEIEKREKQYQESEKMLNREAAQDERECQDEVKYWKSRAINYEER